MKRGIYLAVDRQKSDIRHVLRVKGRLVQQAIHQELSKHYEPYFSESSYGFRPGRSAHQAIEQSVKYCNVYVKSKKAGERVKESIVEFIEKKLKLKVNRSKNGVRHCSVVSYIK